eukprot:5593691-Amphidinium_carterae.1
MKPQETRNEERTSNSEPDQRPGCEPHAIASAQHGTKPTCARSSQGMALNCNYHDSGSHVYLEPKGYICFTYYLT